MRNKDPKEKKEQQRKYRKENHEKVKAISRKSAKKSYKANPEKFRERTRKYRAANPEKERESRLKSYRKHHAKHLEKMAKYRAANTEKFEAYYRNRDRDKLNEAKRRRYKENPEKELERSRKWQRENPEKYRESIKKSRLKNIEKHRERFRKWYAENREYAKAKGRKYTEKHPRAQTEIMTEYRRSHRMCEWSGCDQSKSLHVHHILPLNKYPEYMDEKWNFICYCPFHHFAYHYTFSVSRNNNRHRNALHVLWANTEKWALKNKISIDDLEIELDQMYTPKVILA